MGQQLPAQMLWMLHWNALCSVCWPGHISRHSMSARGACIRLSCSVCMAIRHIGKQEISKGSELKGHTGSAHSVTLKPNWTELWRKAHSGLLIRQSCLLPVTFCGWSGSDLRNRLPLLVLCVCILFTFCNKTWTRRGQICCVAKFCFSSSYLVLISTNDLYVKVNSCCTCKVWLCEFAPCSCLPLVFSYCCRLWTHVLKENAQQRGPHCCYDWQNSNHRLSKQLCCGP